MDFRAGAGFSLGSQGERGVQRGGQVFLNRSSEGIPKPKTPIFLNREDDPNARETDKYN